MKKKLLLITIIGVVGSFASIISLLSDFSFFYSQELISDDKLSIEEKISYVTKNIHIFYFVLFSVITVYLISQLLKQKSKINTYESTDIKLKKHLDKFRFSKGAPDYNYSGFIIATKAFIKNNRNFFEANYDDLIDLADKGINYGNQNTKHQNEHYKLASELKNKLESHLIRIDN